MKYIALLRGINVGGKNKVDMKVLKKTFEKSGAKNVTTYINSGNVIFEDKRKVDTLEKKLEKAIELDIKLKIRVLVKTQKDIEGILKEIPTSWSNNDEEKTDILFLWEKNKTILQEIHIKKVDTVKYVNGMVVWHIKRKNQTKSGLIELIKNKVYKQMTIRNINTVRKIAEIMQKN